MLKHTKVLGTGEGSRGGAAVVIFVDGVGCRAERVMTVGTIDEFELCIGKSVANDELSRGGIINHDRVFMSAKGLAEVRRWVRGEIIRGIARKKYGKGEETGI